MRLLIYLFIILSSFAIAEPNTNVITVNTKAYTLQYDTIRHVPLLVTWKIYNGAGECSRLQFAFKSQPGSATNKDYLHKGFDKGHMADAEDFAYSCDRMRETFSYYNCAPQTPELNRGVWKAWEGRTRSYSKTDSVSISCGPIYEGTEFQHVGVMIIPTGYWKVVQGLSTGNIFLCARFENTKTALMTNIDTATLNRLAIIPVKFKKFN